MNAVDLSPISDAGQTERPFDLFLIFVGANIVATTLQVGASLPETFSLVTALTVITGGAIGGAALVAVLAPIGTRLRVPSIVAARAVLGFTGAQALAVLLFVTNFVWIALNNVIAASICARLSVEGSGSVWAVGLGLLATLVVLGGPRAAALTDRVAVPLLAIAGVVFTAACLTTPLPAWPTGNPAPGEVARGLDMVVGYQVSWLLMFADYPRYVRSARGAGLAVFFGLALTAIWFMPLGLFASRVAQSPDPGAMVFTLGLGWWGALLLTMATLTTNFVNIYMSALALKSLRPATQDRSAVWLIGGIGAALSLLSTAWLDLFAGFTMLLGGIFIPIGGVLVAHYFVIARQENVANLYDANGPLSRHGGWSLQGTGAWASGAVIYYLAAPIGGTVPGLATAIGVYVLLARVSRSAAARRAAKS